VIRVLIVDDHSMVAESLRRVLESEADLDVVAVADTAASAVAVATAERPDVVLMDYHLPDGDGIAATRAIKLVNPDTKVILLTGVNATAALSGALEAGCSGYLEKTGHVDRLADAIRSVQGGGLVLSSDDLARAVSAPKPPERTLTDREMEVLQRLADGSSTNAIAEELGVSTTTVRAHVQRILAKLEVHSRLEAVASARRQGIIRSA
jgi:DNA-binding NarL/FixJ family response regulator